MQRSRSALAALALAGAALLPGIATAQPPAQLRATLFTPTVQWSTTPGAEVRFVLRDAQRQKGAVTVTADAAGEVTATFPQFGGGGRDNTIRAGDLIGVFPTGAEAFTRTVPAMSVALEHGSRTVSGTAPANATLAAAANSADGTELHSTMITAGPDGTYGYALPAEVALDTGVYGTVTLALLGGDAFAVRWDVLSAQVTIGSSTISGRATLGSTVRARLEAGGSVKGVTGQAPTTVLRQPTYSLQFSANNTAQSVAVGDLVTVENGGVAALAGTVPSMTVRIDPATDRVTGVAPPNAEVVATTVVAGSDVSVTAPTDGAGAYVADFGGIADLIAGSTVYVAYTSDRITYRAVGVVQQVRAALYSSQVSGSAPAGSQVQATLYESATGSTVLASGTATTGGSGTFQVSLAEPGGAQIVRTAPGQRLVVAVDSDEPIEIVLSDFTAEADAEADVVSGRALAGAPLTVNLSGGGPGGTRTVETTADASGQYSASFAGAGDVVPGSTGSIVVTLPDGNTVSMNWALPRVAITLGSASISGVGPANRGLTATLTRSGSLVARASTTVASAGGGGGSTFSATLRDGDGAGEPVSVQPGDRLVVTVATWSLDLVVPDVTVEPNTSADSVSGAAPAGADVQVTVSRGPQSASLAVTAGTDGRYVADFAGRWDVAAGDTITSVATLDGGHTVTAEGGAPGLTVYLETGVVSGTAARNVTVQATLRSAAGAVRASGEAEAGGSGRFELTLEDGAGAVAPDAGDVLTVRFGASALDFVIPVFTVTVDASANTVAGQATPGGAIGVAASQAIAATGTTETATGAPDDLGAYSLAFPGGFDIRAGSLLEASYTTPEGHVARIDRRVPMIHAQLGGNLVHGYSAPNAAVSIELTRNAGGMVGADVTADADGEYEAGLLAAGSAPVRIEAGDRLTVDWSSTAPVGQAASGRIAMTVVDISATIDAATRTVSGTTTPGAIVYLTASFGGAGQITIAVLTADEQGRFSQTVMGGGAMGADFSVHVGTLDAEGHRTYYPLVVPYLELVMGSGSVSGRAAPMTDLALELLEGETTIGAAALASSPEGAFEVTLSATGGSAPTVQAGRIVTLTEPRSGTTRVEVPVLTIEFDVPAHVLRGTAPPSTTVPLLLYPPGAQPVSRQTRSGESGAWSIDDGDLPNGADYTIADLYRADARLTVGNGHRVIAIAYSGVPTPTATTEPTPGPTPTEAPPGPEATIYLPFGQKPAR